VAEPFVLGQRTHRLHVRVDSSGHEVAVSPSPAREIDTMVVVADATDARGALRAWRSAALMRTTGRFERLLGWLKAHGRLWRAARTALFWLVTRRLPVRWHLLERLLSCGGGLVGGSLVHRQRRPDGRAECMRHRAYSRRVVRLQLMCNRGQQAGRFITGRVHHGAVELCQGRRHARIPGRLSAPLSPLCPKHAVAHRLRSTRHRPPVKVSSGVTVMSVRGMSLATRAVAVGR